MAIEELAKPESSWCRYCKPDHGCMMYANRPTECESFRCVWLINDLLDDQWRPNKSKLVLTTSGDGIDIRCDPGFPDAWRNGSDQRIVRELEGARVVGVRVVKSCGLVITSGGKPCGS